MQRDYLKMVALGLDLAAAMAEGAEDAIAGANLVKSLVAEGRDPTAAEWDQLNALFRPLVDGIHRA